MLCVCLSLSVSPHTSTGPPSRSEKSPQYSASHSHSPPHTTNEHTKETLSSPDATPPTPRKDGRGHPLLPTPIGPPPAIRGVGDSPTQYPLKSPTPAGLPVGGVLPFSVRSPRPPLLSTPPYPSTVPQPHMAILVWGRGRGGVKWCCVHVCNALLLTQGTTTADTSLPLHICCYWLRPTDHLSLPLSPLPQVPGVYPDPASLGAEPQGMFALTKNSGSGFNPNATPFIPTFVHGLPRQPVAAVAGDPSPQGLMGIPLDQLPRGGMAQSPHMQTMYPNQFSQQVSKGWR